MQNVVVVPNGALPPKLSLPKGNYDQHLAVDTTRIRQELGYIEPVARSEALRRSIEWERAHRKSRRHAAPGRVDDRTG